MNRKQRARQAVKDLLADEAHYEEDDEGRSLDAEAIRAKREALGIEIRR